MSFSKWFNKLFVSKKKEVSHKKCMQLLSNVLDPVIDEEVNGRDEAEFKEHIEKCMPCYERYNLDRTIKEVLKSKCKREKVPTDLVDSIKLKIAQSG